MAITYKLVPCVDGKSAFNEYLPLFSLTNDKFDFIDVLETYDDRAATLIPYDWNELEPGEKKKFASDAYFTSYATFEQLNTLYDEADFKTTVDAVKLVFNPLGLRKQFFTTELVNYGGVFGVWFTAVRYFNEDLSFKNAVYYFANWSDVKPFIEKAFNAGLKNELRPPEDVIKSWLKPAT